MAKKAPAKPPAKRKPRAKKPVDGIELSELSDSTKKRLAEILDAKTEPPKSIAWRSWLVSGAKAAALIVAGAVGGIYAAGGIPIGPGPVVYTDSLAQSHTNDRASQVRILREYAGETFANQPEAQKWLNEQRISARPTDWIPYTDELGVAADQGPDAVKALADKLEGKR
jgi:hypothetical protein